MAPHRDSSGAVALPAFAVDDGQARADQVLTPTTAGGNDPEG
jgi:hypothetical protein